MSRRLLARALERGERARLAVTGSCMEPLLTEGDWAWIEPLSARPRPGEIVLATTSSGDLVCHRVLGSRRGAVMTAGDRGMALDEHPTDAVLGRVTAIERDGRTVDFHRSSVDGALARLHRLAGSLGGTVPGRALNRARRRLRVALSEHFG